MVPKPIRACKECLFASCSLVSSTRICANSRVFYGMMQISTPHPLASCSCAPCISATSAPFQKIPANLRKFAWTAQYGTVGEVLVCSPVQVWAPFAPTTGFHFSTPHHISFMFKYTLRQCNICTMPENTREYSEICVDGTIRRVATKLGLQSRTVAGTV